MRRQAGLTLVELMVVLVIIAILAGVAIPLYDNQVRKSRRTEARAVLEEIALAEERYFTVNGSYGTAAQLGTPYTDAISKMTDGNGDGIPDYYLIAVANTATTYDITATATGPQENDSLCATFSLDELGIKSAKKSDTTASDRCW